MSILQIPGYILVFYRAGGLYNLCSNAYNCILCFCRGGQDSRVLKDALAYLLVNPSLGSSSSHLQLSVVLFPRSLCKLCRSKSKLRSQPKTKKMRI